MHAIVGLGNPGPTYQQTRHNLGWMVLEHAARRWGIALVQQGQALQGEGAIHGHSVLLALPLIWINQTGEVVQSILQDRKLTSPDLIMVYDDLDLPLGALKIKTKVEAYNPYFTYFLSGIFSGNLRTKIEIPMQYKSKNPEIMIGRLITPFHAPIPPYI